MLLKILLGVAIVFVTIYYNCIRPKNYWRNKGIPQGNPWISFLTDVRVYLGWDNLIFSLDRTYRKKPNSRYSATYLLTTPILLIKDPQLLKKVMTEYFGHFTDRGHFYPEGADSIWSNGLIQLKGGKWKRMRPAVSPLFTSGKLKIQFDMILDSAENFIKFFTEKEEDNIELDVKDAMSRYSNDVTALTTFGITMDSMRNPSNEFHLMAKIASNMNSNGAIRFIFACFVLQLPVIKLLGIRLFRRKVVHFFRNIINETVKKRKEEECVRPNLINTFLQAGKNTRNDHATPNEAILSQTMLFFLGGLELTAGVLLFTCYELAVNESIQDKLRHEIMETKNNTTGRLAYDSLLKMKYMDMVISECMRKYPVLPATDRTCTKRCIMEPFGPNEKPLVIEKGTLLWLPIFSLHRDPKLFENPDLFDPERFNSENKHKIDPYSFIPFGQGPRSCIGSRFSLLSIKVAIFYLLSNFKLLPTEKTQFSFKKRALLIAPRRKIFIELRKLKY